VSDERATAKRTGGSVRRGARSRCPTPGNLLRVPSRRTQRDPEGTADDGLPSHEIADSHHTLKRSDCRIAPRPGRPVESNRVDPHFAGAHADTFAPSGARPRGIVRTRSIVAACNEVDRRRGTRATSIESKRRPSRICESKHHVDGVVATIPQRNSDVGRVERAKLSHDLRCCRVATGNRKRKQQ
jgi:hypothetical protein